MIDLAKSFVSVLVFPAVNVNVEFKRFSILVSQLTVWKSHNSLSDDDQCYSSLKTLSYCSPSSVRK